ncbi:MAG: MBL fold metallo-hydrolase, partial [Solirubrobacteraceae bacterium]
MRVRRLGWAAVEVEAAGATAVIDLVADFGSMERLVGPPREPLSSPSRPGATRVAMVTHMHRDHADPGAITAALSPVGVLLRPERTTGTGTELAMTADAETDLNELGVTARTVAAWDSVTVGPFELTAVPSADGFGDNQVGWVVAADGHRIVHYGDTLFHGWWWAARQRVGPFEIAFVPANGPIVDIPPYQPSSP